MSSALGISTRNKSCGNGKATDEDIRMDSTRKYVYSPLGSDLFLTDFCQNGHLHLDAVRADNLLKHDSQS